jgi:hypothetical protein
MTFLRKVLASFGLRCFQRRREGLVSHLVGTQRPEILFFQSILQTRFPFGQQQPVVADVLYQTADVQPLELWRRLVLPARIGNWSLASLQQRLVKTASKPASIRASLGFYQFDSPLG